MKRLLLLGTLLAVASFATGCMTCGGGYNMCGMAPMNCYSTCDPCMTGGAMACPTKYVSPYASQFYQGDECGSPCGGCSSGYGGCGSCSAGYQPFARLCNLLSLGGGSCGCACEKYYGDYLSNPPSLCNPCDQFGGLAGFSAQCSGGGCGGCGGCDTCYGMSYSPMSYGSSYSSMSYGMSMPYAPISQPMVQPAIMSTPRSDCKDCNKGNTFYTSQQVRPRPQMQPMPVQQNMMAVRNQAPMQQPVIIAQSRRPNAQPMTQQPVLQDKLVSVGNTQQINYRMQPVRQVAVRANDQFGSKTKVIQPAVIPTNGRVVHAK